MKAYHVVWRFVAGMLAVVGLSAALLLSPAALLLLAGVAGIGTFLMLLAFSGDGGPSHGDRTGRLITSGLVTGTAAGAFVGFASLLGAGAIPLALVVLGSSPYAAKAWSRWRRSRPGSSTARAVTVGDAVAYPSSGLQPAQVLVEPGLLTDAELCRAWRASYRALQDGSSGPPTMESIAVRQSVLDELERRNSRGLAAWLASGARAAGNPLPYLSDSRVNSPGIDWDELTRGQDR